MIPMRSTALMPVIVAEHEARQGHGRLAEELVGMLDKGKAKLASIKDGKLVVLAGAITFQEIVAVICLL